MGCGAAKVAPQPLETGKSSQINGKPNNNHEPRTNGQIESPVGKSNGHIESEIKPNQAQEVNGNITSKQDNEISNNVDSQEIPNRQLEALSNTSSSSMGGTVPLPQVNKAVAFDIVLGQQKLDKLSVSQKPPRRLKKIESAPTLTREALEQKQAVAEQNRQKELEKKAKVMSKRRSELILAREMDKAQQQKAELEEKLAASEKKRENARAEVVAKQKRREEKAKRVRKMALQIKEGSDVVNVAVDHDDTYNADEEDESWDVSTSAGGNSSVALGENDSDSGERTSSPVQENQPGTRDAVHDFFDS